MRDPFEKSTKGRGWNRLLDFDSWIDSSLYNLFSSGSETWESITIFFRRFKVKGFTKFLVEIVDEGVTLALIGAIAMLALALPAFEETQKDWRSQGDYSVTFLDRNGKDIGQRGIRQNEAVELDELPDDFIKAVLATEDRRFFEHFGIDFLGLTRALAENVRANSVVQGGSTITQQLAKNLFLTNERTLERKIKEAFLSLWLEANLSKKEILKLYIDRAYMGGGNFGISAAAQYYFDKDIKDVNLAEAAMLAGLYKAPGKYAPHINLPAARARANEVLTNIVQAGFMTEGQVIRARREPASVVEREDLQGPNYFMDWAYQEVQRIAVKFKSRNLIVKTTVDLDLQRAAEDSVESHLRQFGTQYGVRDAAMVVMDHEGAVRAIVGGRDYGQSQFNRATSSRRQPGSSFKPYVYAASVENFGYDENTRVVDGSVCLNRFGRNWCPRNYSGGFRGRTDMQTALVKSINTIPVKLYVGRDGLKGLGGEKLLQTVRDVGIESDMVVNPTMVLGSNGVTVLEMATGYGTFMTGGNKIDRHGISQITDKDGNVLYDFRKNSSEEKRIFTEETARVMNTIMAQIPEWGTGRRAALQGIRSAGKTGTTQAYRDAWYVGYTGNYVAAVWFGNDNYQPTRRLTGGRLPAMTWNKFMTYAHQNIELRPIPYIENPFPGIEEGTQPIANADPEGEEELPARPKLLSRKSEDALLNLEKLLREAKPLKRADELAENQSAASTVSQ
ncbi:MAG: PBP1A family penicillin-binding protein [Rhizobiaceae bacterium]|nr:PBP1A family penicillin-binding protein [Rhizobiaceae bacterium]